MLNATNHTADDSGERTVSSAARAHVLIVEDDAAIGDSLAELLEDEGHRVSRAGSVRDGRTALEREAPQVLLVDYMLGGETAEPILDDAAAAVARPTVILMSAAGHAMRVAEARGLRRLAKPFEVDDLLAAIDEALHAADAPLDPGA